MRLGWACAFVVSVVSFAFAFPADIAGLNPISQGLVGAVSSRIIGPAGVFYNPATLAFLERWELEFGYASGNPWFDLQLKDENGENLEDTEVIKDTRETPAFQYVNFGVGGAVNKWIGFGSYLSLNVDGYSRESVLTPQTPYWLKYENALIGQQAFVGFGVKIMPNFSVGGSALFLLDGDGSAELEIYSPANLFEPSDKNANAITTVSASSSTKMLAGATFGAGIYHKPAEFISYGFAFRGPLYISRAYRYDYEVKLPGDAQPTTIPIKAKAQTNFSPAELYGGFTVQIEWFSFSFEGAFTWWSQYKYPYPEVEVGPVGNEIEKRRWDPKVDTYKFADVFSIKTGLEFKPVKPWYIVIGYSYEPSPITKKQDGTTNVLDSNANIFGFTTGGNIPIAKSTQFSLEAGIKYFLLDDYTIEKADDKMNESDPKTNPLYPICDIKSDFYAFSVGARFSF